MDFSKQKRASAPAHQSAMKKGQICIDCPIGTALRSAERAGHAVLEAGAALAARVP